MSMLRFLLIVSLLSIPLVNKAQTNSLPEISPYFSALIVSDMDTSIHWYSHVFGATVLNHFESTERGFKQANLQRGDILIELIELNSAVSPPEAIPNYNNKTRMTGLFKIGFQVSDFDRWMTYLKKEEVEFHGDVVSDPTSGKRMIIIKDPDGNRIQIFEE